MKPLRNFIIVSLALAGTSLPVLAGPATVKDLAIEEARKFDKDHNNKIDGTEAFALRNEFKTNANSHLYMFDENSDHYLDDNEIAKIPLGPPPPPKPAAKPAPGQPAPAQHGRSPSTNHPHGAPRT